MTKKKAIKNTKVSFFKSKEHQQSSDLSLEDALNQIQDGVYKAEITEHRNLLKRGENGLAAELKAKLPAFTPCANYNGRRKKENINIYNNIIIIDIDKLDEELVIPLKELLSDAPYTLAIWISASGRGLKMLVKTNNDIGLHKVVFKNLENYYMTTYNLSIDNSGSDIQRLCYFSYDKDLFVNWDAEVFEVQNLPEVEPSVKISSDTTELEKALADIVTYLKAENKSITSTYDYWYKVGFAIQSVFPNEQGMAIYLDFCRLDKDKHDEEKSKEQWECCLKSSNGTENKVTIKTLFHYAKEEGYDLRKISIQQNCFWNITTKVSKSGNKETIEIDQVALKEFLEKEGFARLKVGKGYIFIRNQNNVISEVTEDDIKDFVIQFVDNLPDNLSPVITKRDLLGKFMKGNFVYFGKGALSYIKLVDIKFHRDTKDEAFVYYKNGITKITKDGVEILDYNSLTECIWSKKIHDREFTKIENNNHVDIYDFFCNVSDCDYERTVALLCTIGYLIHKHKDPSQARAVILMDEEFSAKSANGGTGKSLIAEIVGKIRNVVTVDGKIFNAGKNFAFQRVSLDTNIIYIDDVGDDFAFDSLYSCITGAITIERKNKDEFTIPFESSAKFVLSANDVVSGKGGNSDERRKQVLLLHPHYNEFNTPHKEFGYLFFEDWNKEKWNQFDNFMAECVSIYLNQGLIKIENTNLVEYQLKKEIDSSFLKFMTGMKHNKEYELKTLMKDFKGTNLQDHKYLGQNTFNHWLRRYVFIAKINTKAIAKGKNSPIENRNGSQYIEFID